MGSTDPKSRLLRINNCMYLQNALFEKLPLSFDLYVSLFPLTMRERQEESVQDWTKIVQKISGQGCRQSFKQLFSHFYPLIVAHFQKSGISKEIALELAQESMMKVWNHIKTFDSSKSSLSTWVYVIARNTKYDYLRKIKNDPIISKSEDIFNTLDDQFIDETDLGVLFDINLLKQHLVRLPIEQQHIISEMYLEGRSQQEIAEIYKLPLGTVKSRARLALGSLKKLMEDKLQ